MVATCITSLYGTSTKQSYQETSQERCARCVLSLGLSHNEIFFLVPTYTHVLADFFFLIGH